MISLHEATSDRKSRIQPLLRLTRLAATATRHPQVAADDRLSRRPSGSCPATLIVPSARPLTAPIDLDDCVTFGSGGSRLLAVFTDRDQVADFENAHTLQTTGAELVRLLPDDA